jgi:hypothetical protein
LGVRETIKLQRERERELRLENEKVRKRRYLRNRVC